MTYQNKEDNFLQYQSFNVDAFEQNTNERTTNFGRLRIAALLLIAGITIAVAATSFSSNDVAERVGKYNGEIIEHDIISFGNSMSKFGDLDDKETVYLFETFKSKYSRQYSNSQEESDRFSVFKQFLKSVDERNDAEFSNSANRPHYITKFADYTTDEFKSKQLGYDKFASRPNDKFKSSGVKTVSQYKSTEDKAAEELVNWANVLTTPVKDQGYCGSCWAFSATEQIESDGIRLGFLTIDDVLSPQQIVSCDKNDLGCSGGDTYSAYYYVYSAGGLVSDASYPYTSYYDSTGNCLNSNLDFMVTVSAYYTMADESAMKAHVLSTGPLSVCLDASDWSSYNSGIVSVCGTDIDHCVQVTGINTVDNYWIVRNSWGADWGENGFIYLKYGTNVCGIDSEASYVQPAAAA